MIRIIAIVRRKPVLPYVAVAFTLGDLWGHMGHGVAWTHILASIILDLSTFYLIWTTRAQKAKP